MSPRNSLRVVALALVLALSACSSDTASTTTTASTVATTVGSADTSQAFQRQPQGASSYFSIVEVGIDPDGWVALENFTEVDVTLDGLHICQGEECLALPDEVVPAGETVYLTTGETPDAEGVMVEGAGLGTLAPSDGEIALYVADPGDPDAIIAYLEWGSTPHVHTGAAIAAGLWPEGSYAPTGDDAVRLYKAEESGLWLWQAASG